MSPQAGEMLVQQIAPRIRSLLSHSPAQVGSEDIAVLLCLLEGAELTTLVPKLKRSRSALQGDKQCLAKLVREHLGQDILSQVQESPRWMDTVSAYREKLACRYERQAA